MRSTTFRISVALKVRFWTYVGQNKRGFVKGLLFSVAPAIIFMIICHDNIALGFSKEILKQ